MFEGENPNGDGHSSERIVEAVPRWYAKKTPLLLDTSVLRLHHGRRELLAELARDGHTLATTALNVAELYAGMPPEEESRIENFIDVARLRLTYLIAMT
jgi:hypothetical protein